MIKIGITGGIGSGKSTVSRIFELLKIPVYYSDVEAKHIIDTNPHIIKSITEAFGENSYINNKLNRSFIASIVFKDKSKLTLLNKLTHPFIAEHFSKWAADNNDAVYILKEAAILFESGAYKDLDKIIVVSAPHELRVKRVLQRDGVSTEQVMDRINNQISEEERIKLADNIIYADDINLVIPQVLKIDKQLRSISHDK